MRYILALMLSSTPALAQDYSQMCKDLKSSATTTQLDLTICAGEEAKAVEAELGKKYNQLLADIAAELKRNPDVREDMRHAVRNITAAQSAWTVFRNAYVDAMYPADNKPAAYGSMFSMNVSDIRAQFARQQITLIEALREQHLSAR
jgi:uncharacterized protein YecT (DUF1311 family)